MKKSNRYTLLAIVVILILLIAGGTMILKQRSNRNNANHNTNQSNNSGSSNNSSGDDKSDTNDASNTDNENTTTPESTITPTASPTPTKDPTPSIQYETYTGLVPHIFTHCLIAYPEHKTANGLMTYDSDCINVVEFKRLLNELYANGYSLVDINDTFYEDKEGNMRVAESIKVPVGRKPLIFSVDDVVYDVKKRGNGMVDFLTINDDGNIVTGTYQKDGSVVYHDDNEFIPILEAFIKEHPDFSSNGAKITLCMTGFTGVFGYRTDRNYTGDRKGELEKAQAVADKLKELGYTFASHSYGHYNVTKHSVASLKKDLQEFQNEVVPIIGPTKIFVYPYGKIIYPQDERYKLMQSFGFKVFCSVSSFFHERDYEEGHSIYMTRIAIDGYSLRNYKTVLAPLFDTDKVIDKENR